MLNKIQIFGDLPWTPAGPLIYSGPLKIIYGPPRGRGPQVENHCSRRNRLYICDLNNNRVQVFDLQSVEFVVSIAELFHPQDVHIVDENVYILDKDNPCMHVYSLEHMLLRNIITRGPSSDYQLQVGWFCCVDISGNILIPTTVNIN